MDGFPVGPHGVGRGARPGSPDLGQSRQCVPGRHGQDGGPDRGAVPKADCGSPRGWVVGFWLLWRLEGGFEGLERMGMARTTIYRKIKFFRTITGKHPDEYEIPGVRIDLDKFLAAGGLREGAPRR